MKHHLMPVCSALVVASMCVPARAQSTEKLSVSSAGTAGNGLALFAATSATGRYVVFASTSTNIAPGTTNGSVLSVFLRDRQLSTTELISKSASGIGGNDSSWLPSISADGRFVAYLSRASNLIPGIPSGSFALDHIYVNDRLLGTTIIADVNPAGIESPISAGNRPMLSSNGRFVTFYSASNTLVQADTNGVPDVFVRDLQTATTERVSVDSAGTQANGGSFENVIGSPAISGDGRFVAFVSHATNLGGTYTQLPQAFVRDRLLGTTTLVSVGASGIGANTTDLREPAMSADGRFVAFTSSATNLVPGFGGGGVMQVFLRDLAAGTTSVISVNPSGTQESGKEPSISTDGRFVSFSSTSTNLVSGPSSGSIDEVYVRDRLLGQSTRVSVGFTNAPANIQAARSSISADGRYVAFDSPADNLVPNDVDGSQNSQVFLRDRGAVTPYPTWCLGDGTGAACPCANTGATGHGCSSSANPSGAVITAAGFAGASAATDSLVLSASDFPGPGMFLQADSISPTPTPFGDGHICVGVGVLRLGVVFSTAGVASYPSGLDAISIHTAGAINSGDIKHYQCWYRDSVPFCNANTFNLTQGLSVTWAP